MDLVPPSPLLTSEGRIMWAEAVRLLQALDGYITELGPTRGSARCTTHAPCCELTFEVDGNDLEVTLVICGEQFYAVRSDRCWVEEGNEAASLKSTLASPFEDLLEEHIST